LVWIDPAKQRHEPSPAMTLGNMRELGVRHLVIVPHRPSTTMPALVK
jgi:hypothetical protein